MSSPGVSGLAVMRSSIQQTEVLIPTMSPGHSEIMSPGVPT